jgi:hypothetical protein
MPRNAASVGRPHLGDNHAKGGLVAGEQVKEATVGSESYVFHTIPMH